MEPRLMDVLQGKEDNYILPFFWQHGESKELLEEGMQRIYPFFRRKPRPT